MATSTTRAKAPGTGPTGPTGPSTPADPAVTRSATRPDLAEEPATVAQRALVGIFVVVPLLALIAAIPLAWGWGLGWHDVVIALVFYWLSGLRGAGVLHRRLVQGEDRPAGGAGGVRHHGHRGPGVQLGRRPPAAPQVQRPGRRPALAVAVRRR